MDKDLKVGTIDEKMKLKTVTVTEKVALGEWLFSGLFHLNKTFPKFP